MYKYPKIIFVIKVSQPESSESVGIGGGLVESCSILTWAVKVQSVSPFKTIICNLLSLFTSGASPGLQYL